MRVLPPFRLVEEKLWDRSHQSVRFLWKNKTCKVRTITVPLKHQWRIAYRETRYQFCDRVFSHWWMRKGSLLLGRNICRSKERALLRISLLEPQSMWIIWKCWTSLSLENSLYISSKSTSQPICLRSASKNFLSSKLKRLKKKTVSCAAN